MVVERERGEERDSRQARRKEKETERKEDRREGEVARTGGRLENKN